MIVLVVILAIIYSSSCLPFLSKLQEPVYESDLVNTIEENMINDEFDLFQFAYLKIEQQINRKNHMFENALLECQLLTNKTDLKKDENFAIIPIIDSLTEYNMRTSHYCNATSISLESFPRRVELNRIFLIDRFLIGVIQNSLATLKIYQVNKHNLELKHLYTKKFQGLIPMDSCSLSTNDLYVVFPDQNMLKKYKIKYMRDKIDLKETFSVFERGTFPSAISCSEGLIYVTERPSNNVRVYNRNLSLVSINRLNGVIQSVHKSISVTNDINVLVDGLDGIALFNKGNQTFKNSQPFNICHFYKNMNCVEEVNAYVDKFNRSFIYAVDNCKNELIEFSYKLNQTNLTDSIKIEKKFGFPNGILTDSVRSKAGFLAITSHSPSRIKIIDLGKCGGL